MWRYMLCYLMCTLGVLTFRLDPRCLYGIWIPQIAILHLNFSSALNPWLGLCFMPSIPLIREDELQEWILSSQLRSVVILRCMMCLYQIPNVIGTVHYIWLCNYLPNNPNLEWVSELGQLMRLLWNCINKLECWRLYFSNPHPDFVLLSISEIISNSE